MDLQLYAIHVVPLIVIVYFGFLLFIQPPKEVIIATLTGGLVMAIINLLVDILAYHASIWHYTASGLILQLPLPLYLTPVFIYGGIGYLLMWRFRPDTATRGHWFAWLLLIGIPVFGFVRDLLDATIIHSSFIAWTSPLAAPLDFVQWVVMFYAGYFVFRRLLPSASGERKPQTNP
jgi:hypothetical protein